MLHQAFRVVVSAVVAAGMAGATALCGAMPSSAAVVATPEPTSRPSVGPVVPAALAAAASAAQKLDVVVATPKGRSVASVKSWITQADVQSLVADVSTYWSAQSGGKVTFTLAALAYLPSATASCATDSGVTSLWSAASKQLFHQDWWKGPGGPTSRQHLVVLYPYAPGDLTGSSTCAGTLGVGTVPDSGASIADGGLTFALFGGQEGAAAGSAAKARAGQRQYYAARQTLAHELGHNFGLEHSGTAWCDPAPVDGSYGSSACVDLTYVDVFDPMGGGTGSKGVAPLSTPDKLRLGLLPANRRRTETAAATTRFTLGAVENGGAGNGSLQSIAAVDPKTHERYYIEYRRPSAGLPGTLPKLKVRDARGMLDTYTFGYGVRILRIAPTNADSISPWAGSSEQLIVPIGSATSRTSYLPAGKTFITRSGTLKITAGQSGATSAPVTITIVGARPTMTLTRSHATQTAGGTPVTVTATLPATYGSAPTGTVMFHQGSKVLATVQVRSGKASYTLPRSATVGTHIIGAAYRPDAAAQSRAILSATAAVGVPVVKVVRH